MERSHRRSGCGVIWDRVLACLQRPMQFLQDGGFLLKLLMGWFAELPGSQVSHRNYSSNIINMCALLRKPCKHDPAALLPDCGSRLKQCWHKRWKGSAFPAQPSHTTLTRRGGPRCCHVSEAGWDSHVRLSPLVSWPHVLAVSSTSPGPAVSGQKHDVAQQHHSPYSITCPVLPHSVHTGSDGGRKLWGEKELSVGPQQLQPPAHNPWAHCQPRGQIEQKNTATALPRGGSKWAMGYLRPSPCCKPFGYIQHPPGICLLWWSRPASHLFSSSGLRSSTRQWNPYVIKHFRKMNFPSFALNLLLNEFTR